MNYIETFKLDKNRNKIKIKMIDLENYSKIYSGNNYKLIHKNGGRGLILHQTLGYLMRVKRNKEKMMNQFAWDIFTTKKTRTVLNTKSL
jgi:hypothetical protein